VDTSPYVAIENEPAPKLIVDPSLSDQLARGIVQIQYRVENVRIVPVFGAGALKVSPRVGHLHITVDDLPWHWADTNDNNTIDVVGLPPGQHKVLIELVNPEHHVFTRQGQTVTFAVPGPAKCVTRAAPQLARPRPRQIGDAQHPAGAVIAFAPSAPAF
jgi:Family of unknown function (DUF6130)